LRENAQACSHDFAMSVALIGENAAAPVLAKKLSCRPVTSASTFFVAFEKTNRDIDRNNFQIWAIIEQLRKRDYFPNNQLLSVHYNNGPTPRRAVYTSHAGHISAWSSHLM
jgi:hypothetical protein